MYDIDKLPNLIKKFKNVIFLDTKHLFPNIEADYDMNHIRQFQGIILGRPGSGKTQVANWLAGQLIQHYGEDAVNAVSSNSLHNLLRSIDDKLVNFLFLDDLTLTKTTTEELAQYFRVRHIIQSITGRRHGIVLTMLGLHRFYGCDPSIRTNFDFLMFRSAPTNDYDRRWTIRHIGKEPTDILSNLELDRNKKIELYNTTITWLKGTGSGFLNTPLPKQNNLHKSSGYGYGYGIVNKEQVYKSFKWRDEF